MKARVYYIEDEEFLGKIVMETLEKQGYELRWETDGAKVMSGLQFFTPDIVVLDIMLPNVDGYTLCRQIHAAHPRLPIIFLTAKVETADLVRGFESGGSDYMRKPFSIEELVVRINNLLSIIPGSKHFSSARTEEIEIGKYIFRPGSYELITPSGMIKLSHRELEVLQILVAYRNKVADRKDLLKAVWGDDSFFNSRNLDVYIRKLRAYFEEDSGITIQTLKGKGYLFLVR
ncbi:MAG: response regulator transcription factor [Bacteroidales bacterium]|nr:response regulator transcription factor [Bacteroidales bacterium]